MADPRATMLVVEDDESFRLTVRDFFASDALDVLLAGTVAEAVTVAGRRSVDVVLLDQKLPDALGIDACKPLLEHNDRTRIIFITAYPNLENAVGAIRAGAYDYLSKPVDLDELQRAVQRALEATELDHLRDLRDFASRQEQARSRLIGSSAAMDGVRQLADLAARSLAPLLITGETGVGKGVVARYVHYRGASPGAPFVSLNAAAIPRELIESELFGHERGAFTGATTRRRGAFELAHGGTLLLDEIGCLDPGAQSKLLAVLEEGRVQPVGAERARAVSVRVIAATNADLRRAIRERQFRDDLYYRLNVVQIHVPPLRRRPQDIPELCKHFVDQLAPGRAVNCDQEELETLLRYRWPGNVRELRNVLERTVTLSPEGPLQPSRFVEPDDGARRSTVPPPAGVAQGLGAAVPLRDIERRHIEGVLESTDHNLAAAARVLEISESTIRRRLRSFKNRP